MAACDREGLLAYPVQTVRAGAAAPATLRALVAEYEPTAVVVGLPRSLDGRRGPAADKIASYAAAFAREVDVPVLLVDERLTTVAAARQLRAAGRSARQQRAVIDQQAAVGILEAALELHRNRGLLPGRVLSGPTAGRDEPSAPDADDSEGME